MMHENLNITYNTNNSVLKISTVSNEKINIKKIDTKKNSKNAPEIKIPEKTEIIYIEECTFEFLNLKFEGENNLKDLSIKNCKLNNLGISRSLVQNAFLYLFNLCLQYCNICNIEDLTFCLVNIKKMENIDLRGNKIRSLQPIIKLNSDCNMLISKVRSLEDEHGFYIVLNSTTRSNGTRFIEVEDDHEEPPSYPLIRCIEEQLKYAKDETNNYLINIESFHRSNLSIQGDLPLYNRTKIKYGFYQHERTM